MIKLTKEEIADVVAFAFKGSDDKEAFVNSNSVYQAVALEAQRKMVKWLKDRNEMEEDGRLGTPTWGLDLYTGMLILETEDWQSIKEELGL